MSWLTDIFNFQKNNKVDLLDEKHSFKEYLYMSIQSNYICLLVIDETTDVGNIIYKEDIYLGPYEDLKRGENVRDIYTVMDKILKDKKSLFEKKAGIFVSLPAIGNFFKNIEVPKLPTIDMKRLVLSEMKRILPVDFSQVLYAENDLGQMNDGKNSFFSVCVQKLTYEKFDKIFKDNKINVNFEIEIFSLARIAKRDKEYRAVVFVNNFYTLVVVMHGQIIHEAKIIEKGTYEMCQKIASETGIDVDNAYKLFENFSKIYDENRPSSKVLASYLEVFSFELNKLVSATIFQFEKKYNVFSKEIILAGSGANIFLLKDLSKEFDKDSTVSIIGEDNLLRYNADNFDRDDLKRYAQCFGLALKHK